MNGPDGQLSLMVMRAPCQLPYETATGLRRWPLWACAGEKLLRATNLIKGHRLSEGSWVFSKASTGEDKGRNAWEGGAYLVATAHERGVGVRARALEPRGLVHLLVPQWGPEAVLCPGARPPAGVGVTRARKGMTVTM